MNNTSIFDKDLNPVLEIADNDDLELLVEYLKEKLSESLTSNEAYEAHYPKHTEYADLIGKEIREMGGNSFVNIMARRGEGPTYHEIVCDVASKLKAPYNADKSIEDIENSILETILTTAIDHMTDDKKRELLKEMGTNRGINAGGVSTAVFIGIFRAGGFYSYQLTLIIANQIARAMLGHGLKLATNAALVRWASVLTGPVGWAITGLWTAVDIAGPAYKVTIPCVIHIAMLRKKLNSLTCSKCTAILPDTTMKFCPECGEAIKG